MTIHLREQMFTTEEEDDKLVKVSMEGISDGR